MRVKSAIWVGAYVRRCHAAGAYAVVRRRGAEEAGAVFVTVDRLDGTATLYGPAPQAVFDEAKPADRAFMRLHEAEAVPLDEAERLVARELRFDSDLWLVAVEDRAGRAFLDWTVPR